MNDDVKRFLVGFPVLVGLVVLGFAAKWLYGWVDERPDVQNTIGAAVFIVGGTIAVIVVSELIGGIVLDLIKKPPEDPFGDTVSDVRVADDVRYPEEE